MRTYDVNSQMWRFSRGAQSVDVPDLAVFAAMGKFSPGMQGTAVSKRFLDAVEEFIFSIAAFRGYGAPVDRGEPPLVTFMPSSYKPPEESPHA